MVTLAELVTYLQERKGLLVAAHKQIAEVGG